MDARRKRSPSSHSPIAVVGLGCVFPGAPDVPSFWNNVVAGASAITTTPPERWDVSAFFDENPDVPDRSYCAVGGFVRDWTFDGRAFRLPPATARVMDRAQQYALVAARQAFADAGLDRAAFDRDRTAVVIGLAGGRLENEERLLHRLHLPILERALQRGLDRHGVDDARRARLVAAFREEYLGGLVEVTEDTFAGLCPNVVAGRIANYFDLHGANYVVDAACASSLAAVDCAMDHLRRGDADTVVCGGVHAHMGLALFIGFSKFHGLSTRRVSPFDESADGFLLGEGAGIFVLRRLDDALRDGNRVVAVLRGAGSSSDGREKGIGAPNPKAQALAMRRAFEAAGVSPGTVQLVETHGAGTSVGDPAELDATFEVYGPHLAPGQRIAITAVKSQVGHLMGASGAAGLMKTLLGLHHGVMPPTINHTRPNPSIPWDRLPFDVVTAPRPWEENRDGEPRRAGVSSFGFGGNNFHLVAEAFDPRVHRPAAPTPSVPPASREPIAIIGLGASLPGAPDVETYWRNILEGVSGIVPVPPDRWEGSPDLYYDPDPDAPDKTVARMGGFTSPQPLDGRRLRITPATLQLLDPCQKELIATALAAIDETRILDDAETRRQTAVIFGDSSGCRELMWSHVSRMSARRGEVTLQRVAGATGTMAPQLAATIGAELVAEVVDGRPPITEDGVTGIATSIDAARIAKGLDLMGTHMVIDAACGSSLAAITLAVCGLQSGKWDVVVAGGVAGGLTPTLAVLASKARALSGTGTRPFDEGADGFIASDGAAAFVLKRLGDAVEAGDRIYGVIRGVGASSDGRGHSMYAPDWKRQALAVSRAYADCSLAPSSVQYVECHATSTPVGDPAELSALREVFGERAAERLHIGSVKGQIGHTLSAAGAAALMKTVLGLSRRTLPPMPPVERPIAAAGDEHGPFRLVTAPLPWQPPSTGEPRRAGVNAFGFGGTNWHIVVEEFAPPYHEALLAAREAPQAVAAAHAPSIPTDAATPANLFVAAGATADAMRTALGRLDFAKRRHDGDGPWRIAFVARSKSDFLAKTDLVAKHFRAGRRSPLLDAQGVYATDGSPAPGGLVAGVFPGQGPQYADMLRDLAEEHEVVRQTLAEAGEVLREQLGGTFQDLMFTATRSAEERAALEQAIAGRSDIVQPVLVTANVALFRLAASQGVGFHTFTGHSLGEYAALVAAGVLDFAEAVRAAHARGRAFRDLAERSGDAGRMATVAAGADAVGPVLETISGYVAVANRNCPGQTVISGEDAAVAAAVAALEAQGVECRILPIAGAFHSKIAASVRGRMEEAVARLAVRPPAVPVLSSVDLEYYGAGVDCAARVRRNLVEQLVTPVDFIGVVERLYADGHRLFVEPGPKNALTGFIDDILGEDRPHRALFANHPKVGEIPQLDRFVAQHALARGEDVRVTGDTGAAAGDGRVNGTAVAVRPASPRSAAPSGDGEPIWITGVSVGLPGRNARVFADDGLDRLLGGACLIDPVPDALQDRMVAKRITRLVKSEGGEPYLDEVRSRADAVKLAGQRGGFSLRDDFGLDEEWLSGGDVAYQLAVAAGLEALRDARLPLQPAYRRTSRGGALRQGWMLPAPLQPDTAVVFASAFPGHNHLFQEAERYYASTYGALAASSLREQYLRRLEDAKTEEERLDADQWFVDQRRAVSLDGKTGGYRFNRTFLADYVCMGNARFAQLVHARGPNLAVNSACCSTTVALAAAEDMIRLGRARRVVVIGADDVSSEALFEWIVGGFLAAGAAATDASVGDAALPFDRRRHGMLVGMGAVGFVVEAAKDARQRGIVPVAELLGVRMANSASHMTRPDTEHVVAEMQAFLAEMQARHGIDAAALAPNLVYGSHETFTLPSGGIGAVEGRMLKQVFGDRWRDVLVVNTKCSTGHPQGASLEDAILMKALQAGRVPPVLHSTEVDQDLAGINLSKGGTTEREYALRFTAGFGSQVAMSLTRVGPRVADRVTSAAAYQVWLEEVTGVRNASLAVVNRILQVKDGAEARVAATAATAPPAVTPAPAQRPPEGVRSGVGRQDPGAGFGTEVVVTGSGTEAVGAGFSRPDVGPGPQAVGAGFSRPDPVTPPAAAPTGLSVEQITEKVMSIIEEKTGYERKYLEVDLDLEADLGIDTIKQAQVMGRIRETFALPKDKNIRVKDFPTIRQVVQYVQDRVGGASPGQGPAEAAPHESHQQTGSASAPRTGDAWRPASAPASVHPVQGAPPQVWGAASAGPIDAPPALRTAAPPAASDDRILDAVLRIVEKQTGYEREALGEDLDLEADLGIDTIKQAQVMGKIREEFNLPREQGIRVKDYPTIRHVVGFIAARLGPATPVQPTDAGATLAAVAAPAPVAAAVSAPTTKAGDAAQAASAPRVDLPGGICRMAVRSTAVPIEQEQANLALGAGWTVLVTDDGLGVADALKRSLEGAGAQVAVVRAGEDVAAARARLGRVRALVLAHPLAMDPAMAALDAQGWRGVLDRKVTSSFRAIQALRGEIELAVAVTAMAGPYGWRGQLVDPAGAGVAGLLKSLKHEAEAVLVKVVDVERPAARVEAEHVAATILREIERGGTRMEVGYREGQRLVPRVVREPLDLTSLPVRTIGPESVIVAIGGSRGVTAAVVKELARRYRPRLVLVATRPLPSNVAELTALDADGLKQLKEKLAKGWKARVMGAKPVEIERRFAATLQAIDAYRTMQACEAAGSAVSYEVCDVRDADRVRELVKGVARQHGRIDGVVFGAGTIEDKLIADKALDSFDRVLGVKAEGIFNLYKALDGVPVSFLAAFTSVAGRFGNVGQADYSAGNEIVARTMSLMQAARPDARCLAIDWTGWDEVGLAARSGVIELLKDEGFQTLSPAEGARFFHEELVFGPGPDEVVVASDDLPIDRDGQMTPAPGAFAAQPASRPRSGVFLDAVHAAAPGAWLVATTTVEPHADAWLRDHVIDGTPLVPAVFGIEIMAEAATLLMPGFHLWGVRDLELRHAVKVMKDRARTLKVTAVARTGDTDDERIVRVTIASDFTGPDGRVLVANRVHFTCEVVLRTARRVAAAADPDRLAGVAAETAIPRLYGEGGALPHGPTFQVLDGVSALDAGGVVASVAAFEENRVFPSLNGHSLLTQPFAREAAFQSAGLWGILRHRNFGLPHGCRALHTFGPPPKGTRLLVRVVPRAVDAVRIEYDIDLLGDDGRLYDRMEGFYTVNPLAAAERSARTGEDETGA